MRTLIAVYNEDDELVRSLSLRVTSPDHINVTEAILDAERVMENLVNRWIHLEGVTITISSDVTSGDKDA